MSALTPVTEEQHGQILASRRSESAHRGFIQSLACMNELEEGGRAKREKLPASLSVVAWNVERCLFPAETAAHIAGLAPDVILLSEVDYGMARTGQRNTTREVAEAAGMRYVFGVEFYELGLGSPVELQFCSDHFNHLGWHGNAILSAAAPLKTALLRLDDNGRWFTPDFGADPKQPRIGGRLALFALIPAENGPVCVVSTHLESNSGAEHRAGQFRLILDEAERFAEGAPVLIGGDLNTGNHMPPDYDWRKETLFAEAESRGYSWDFTPEGMTTRPSLITRHPDREMKLDWICGRGFTCREKRLISSLSADGKPLSDHDAVWCRADIT